MFVVQTPKQCSAFQHSDTKITEITRGSADSGLIDNKLTDTFCANNRG